MKNRKLDWKHTLIMALTFIISLLLFHHWDKLKAFIAAIFS
jgi:uncharacterized MnhB-related membrane protein